MPTFAKEDARSSVAETLRDLNMKLQDFACYQFEDHIPYWTIARIMRDERAITESEAKHLLEMCSQLRSLASRFPCRLDFSDTYQIRALLRNRPGIERLPGAAVRPTVSADKIESSLDERGF
jgi:hypothetical protein